MCGIVGLLADRPLSGAASFLDRMRNTLNHRGPDCDGVWFDLDAGVAFGHTRLSIVDLSPAGAQPMTSADGKLVIVFNGEIYNHGALRTQLEHAGVNGWRGRSDTEVLLQAISTWGGEAALTRIEGQFAFAVWDRSERRLMLARDRFGEKPLYYGRVGAHLVFASELKAFRAHPAFTGDLDHDALSSYIRYGYVPHPRSIYRGIRKLPQGSWIRFRARDGFADAVEPHTYWSQGAAVGQALADPFQGTEDDAVEEVDRLLGEAVQARMVADVPLGALLSGGIDSSLTVALMQARSSRPVKTFTIGSWDQRLDEAVHAKETARVLGTDHTELYVGPQQALDVIPQLAGIYDEPFADSSQIPTCLVSRLARSQVTVALSGDGGDELFAGYNRHRLGEHWRILAKTPRPLRAMGAESVLAVPPSLLSATAAGLGRLAPRELRHGEAGDKLHKWADKARADTADDFIGKLVSVWDAPGEVLIDARPAIDVVGTTAGLGFAHGAMYGDTQYYLPDDILVKVDRASMAASLEVRTPYLDTSVFDFAWRLPLGMKIRGGVGKHILRRTLGRHVPIEMFERPKQGFAVPIAAWLRGDLRDWAENLLDPRRLTSDGLFSVTAVRRTWHEHLSGRRNWDTRLWTLLMMQAWLENNRSSIPSPTTTYELSA